MAEPFVPLGEIVTTHGLDGWLKLNPFNLNSTALVSGVEVILEKTGQRSAHAARGEQSASQSVADQTRWRRQHRRMPRSWSDRLFWSPKLRSGSLEPGQYYHYQVVGFEVFSASGERIGIISSTLSTPGGELYVVQGTAKEHLIPAVKEFIDKVDFTDRQSDHQSARRFVGSLIAPSIDAPACRC